MKIAIPIANGKLSPHFGHCERFAVLTADLSGKKVIAREYLTPPPHEPGVLPRWLHSQDIKVIIAGGMGQRAQQLFAEQDIQVVTGAPPDGPETLAAAYLSGTLQTGANSCDH